MPAETYRNIAGVWSKLVGIYANSGGAWRDVQEAWCNVGGTWVKVFSKGIVSVPTGNVVRAQVPSAQAVISFTAAGTISYGSANAHPADTNWFTPTTTDVGVNYWIRATPLGGTSPAPNGGSSLSVWHQLNVARSWSLTTTNSDSDTLIRIQIASDSAGNNILATGDINLQTVAAG